ncbi:MAG: phosphoserine phosphatase SerB, partial [Rhizobiales bacterium]|nr:phosphoserine phosphatase SerB [Hyphomicrobiales bacterium]
RLLVSDMDSTIIGQECVDEIAECAGVGSEVAAITERAMAGELNFRAALAERVGLLKGLDEAALDRVMAEKITLNPGATTLVATMRQHGAFTLLVSGGFTFCASEIAERAGFDDFAANRLIVEDGKLAGRVAEPILGREAKLAHLLAACQRLAIEPADVLGLGDGANDLALIENAGLGVAYRAKPILADHADGRIDHTDFTAALYFQGYRRADFAGF